MTAFAIRRGDLPGEDTDTAESIGSDVATGSDGDPDDLLVKFGVNGGSCADPNPVNPCDTWTVTVILSPAQQTTGTYTDSEVDAFYGEQGAPDTGSCGGTGSSLDGFTIIVESIDDGAVELVFEGDGLGPDSVDLNGLSVTATRC